jgi:hypothetical protein
MKIIKPTVSRDLERSQAIARAQIALHHWTRFTGAVPPLERLLTGLERRKIIARRLSCRS